MIKSIINFVIDFVKIFYTKGIWSLVIVVLFLAGFAYLLLPEPSSINEFPALPNSKKSDLPGDTIQNPNIAAYFSDYRREDIMNYYYRFLTNWSYSGIRLPVFKINHPPERAFTFIRDQQESTALEEYYVPFRGSLYVNVHDPIIYNKIRNRPLDFITSHLEYENVYYNTKTTLRYYPTPVAARLSVYLLTIFCIYMMVRLILFYHRKD